MKKVGQILKEAREKKDISFEEAEKATKIRKKVLQALEASSWKELPTPTFVKGLLKNYGEFLGLNTQTLIAFFRREYEEPKTQKNFSPKLRKPKFRFTPQALTAIAFAGIFLLATGYLFTQYRSFTSAPILEVTEPANNIKIQTLDVNVVGKTYPDAGLKINGQSIQLSAGGTFSAAVSLVEGINTITVTAENQFGKISTEKRTVVVETKTAGLEDKKTNSELSLTLNIGPQAANVRVEQDGENTFQGVLVSGTSRNFSARERVKILTSNAGSTKVVIEGKEEILGKEGETIEKVFTKR